MRKKLSKYIGDKPFYMMVLGVALPIMIQNGITNFVSLLDNIMVGQVGTDPMSGVAIVNQLLFVFNLCIFGAVSGAGIFGAQYAGSGNQDGLRSTTQFKLILGAILLAIGFLIIIPFGERLIGLFLHDGSETGSIEDTLNYGKAYLSIMLWGLPPFVLLQVYASTLRETGQTRVPMTAGIVAVLCNLTLNYILIFGHFGLPAMGVRGAALATVISRYVELAIAMIYTHTHRERCAFAVHLYTRFHISGKLARDIIIKGLPLMYNELLWSGGMTILTQCYSTRGLDAVAAVNITSTIVNVFSVVFFSVGVSVGIIVGQLLGAGKMEEARQTDTRLIALSVAMAVVVGAALIVVAPLFPRLYETSQVVRDLAVKLIRAAALIMPADAFANATYFTLRSGGKSGITFIFDSGFVWALQVPVAFILSRFTGLSIAPLYAACQALFLLKALLGYVMVKRGTWVNNLVAE